MYTVRLYSKIQEPYNNTMAELDTKIKKECSECGKQFESNDDSAYCSFECAYGLNVL